MGSRSDDLLLFCAADPHSLHLIMSTLSKFHKCSGLQLNQGKSSIIYGGCNDSLKDKCNKVVGFSQGTLPMKYLAVAVTDTRFTNMECQPLLDKIAQKIRVWASAPLSYAARTTLINSVLFGAISYWASIFIFPKEVLLTITKMCRNFLWSGAHDYSRSPYVSWEALCQPKSKGGLGVKSIECWNKAKLAKLVWDIASKKDTLWVKWVNGRYIKDQDWLAYNPPHDCSWYWRKLCKLKTQCLPLLQTTAAYKLNTGYTWFMPEKEKAPWARQIWVRSVHPRHAFLAWLIKLDRLPTKARLQRLNIEDNPLCPMRSLEPETAYHLFYQCSFARQVWSAVAEWSQMSLPHITGQIIPRRMNKAGKMTLHAITAVAQYSIWTARNIAVHKGRTQSISSMGQQIRHSVLHRLLFLNRNSNRYTMYVDRLLA